MTLALVLSAAIAFLGVVCGALGFGSTRSRTSIVARALFYAIVTVTLVSLVVGIMGVARFI